MKTLKRMVWIGAALVALVPLYGVAESGFPAMPEVVAEQDSFYADGTRAMNEQRWQDAVAAFDKVASGKGHRADAALYWKAYSLKKLGNAQAALSTCDQLRAQAAASPWNRDCMVLAIETKVNAQVRVDSLGVLPVPPIRVSIPPIDVDLSGLDAWKGRGDEDDLKLMAMNSLLNQDPAKAIPLLRGLLTGSQPPSVKKHALFVLSQSKAPEADAILHDAVLGKLGPEVQRDAIQSTGVFRGKRDDATLVEVYRGTADVKIKRSVVSALFISKDAPRMVELARNEKDMALKRTIVSQLALMQDKAAEDYMMELLK